MKNARYLQLCEEKNFKCTELFANDSSLLAIEAQISEMDSSNPV